MKIDQESLNLKHLSEPRVGDYWQERFCPVLVIVNVISNNRYLICEKRISVDVNHWTWDLSNCKIVDLIYLNEKLKYKSSKLNMQDKCWADVVPEAHKWVRQEAKEFLFGEITV